MTKVWLAPFKVACNIGKVLRLVQIEAMPA